MSNHFTDEQQIPLYLDVLEYFGKRITGYYLPLYPCVCISRVMGRTGFEKEYHVGHV